ncbi:hypothetical protein B0H10DRAFT_2388959 [Mycena sp. CBHHK59/15]|nr:hypothetical protein B0H10DRAFT_2388959 [Mycena sp. CBHHK59/15]
MFRGARPSNYIAWSFQCFSIPIRCAFEEPLWLCCGFHGTPPYRDWTKDAPHFYESTFFKDSDPRSGLGGWVEQLTKFQVLDKLIHGYVGDFKGFQANTEGGECPHTSVHYILGRDGGGICPVEAPADCISRPTFSPHGLLPTFLPVISLGSFSPPIDPFFFLHHAMVDRMWFKWKQKHQLNRYAHEGGSVQRLENDTIFDQYPTEGPPFLTVNSPIPHR